MSSSPPGARSSVQLSHTRPPSRPWGPVVGIVVLGAVLTLGGLASTARRQAQADFELLSQRAREIDARVRESLELPVEALRTIPTLFTAMDDGVSREEFAAYCAPILARHPGIYALEWLPLVTDEERATVEAQAQADGVAGFGFTELGPDGRMVPSRHRVRYLPILYSAPPNAALGFDVISEDSRRATAWRSRDTGDVVASERFRLVEDPEGVFSAAVYAPVYRGHPTSHSTRVAAFRGFAVMILRIGSFVERALPADTLEGLEVAVVDEDAEGETRVLYESRAGAFEHMDASESLVLDQTRPFASRDWTVWIRGEPGIAPAGFTRYVPVLIGPLVTAVLLLGWVAWTRIGRLRRQVEQALQLGQYHIAGKLGEGGMGAVYKAEHALLRRPTAIKLVTGEDRTAVARFEREVRLSSKLTHPNTILVYDYGHTPSGIFYYAMELVDGPTFAELMRVAGPLPPRRAVHLLRQVAGALAEAHQAGVVHRDIKPGNLMVCRRGRLDDFVKVLDFGLVKDLADEGASHDLSEAGALLGTPLYMSPEAIRAAKVGPAADVYALGAVAYFLLTGRPPFEGPTSLSVCTAHLTETPAPPSERQPDVPASVDDLVMRCLEKEISARPPDAAALLRELDALQEELGPWTQADAATWWESESGRAVRTEIEARIASAVDALASTDVRNVEIERGPGTRHGHPPEAA